MDVWASKGGQVEEISFAVMVVMIWGNTGKKTIAALKPGACYRLQYGFVPLSQGAMRVTPGPRLANVLLSVACFL